MIKVGHIVTHYSSAVTILRSKLAALDAYDDLDVSIVTGPVPPEWSNQTPPVRHIEAPLVRPIRPIADARCILALRKLFKRERFDIVHTHTSKAGVAGAMAARLAGTPLILHTYHGLPFFEGQNPLPYHIYKTFDLIGGRCRHYGFSQNRRDLPACAKLIGSPDRVFFEGNGVDIAWVEESARLNAEKAERDFPAGAPRIALISRLELVKRIEDFVAACAEMRDGGLNFSAVIAGSGPLEDDIRRDVERRGLSDRVRMLGWCRHVHAIMAAADIVTLTSVKEGLPRALMESMALEKPIVATDVPGTQELVVNNETGFLTPFSDTHALADCIKRLATDPDLRARMGRSGKARIESDFNDVKIAAFLRDFYIKHLR